MQALVNTIKLLMQSECVGHAPISLSSEDFFSLFARVHQQREKLTAAFLLGFEFILFCRCLFPLLTLKLLLYFRVYRFKASSALVGESRKKRTKMFILLQPCISVLDEDSSPVLLYIIPPGITIDTHVSHEKIVTNSESLCLKTELNLEFWVSCKPWRRDSSLESQLLCLCSLETVCPIVFECGMFLNKGWKMYNVLFDTSPLALCYGSADTTLQTADDALTPSWVCT